MHFYIQPFSAFNVLQRFSRIISIKCIDKSINPTRKRDIREIISRLQKSFRTNKAHSYRDVTASQGEIKAVQCLDNALSYNSISHSRHYSELRYIKLLMSYSEVQLSLGHTEMAIDSLAEALAVSEKLNNSELSALIQLKHAKISYSLNKLEEAAAELNLAISYYRETHNLNQLLDGLRFLGMVFQRKGRYVLTLETYGKALQLAHQIHNTEMIASLEQDLGVIQRIIGNESESESLLLSAKSRFQRMQIDAGVVDSQNNLALTYLQKHNYQKALTGFNECVSICKENDHLQMMTYINLNKALFYLEVGDPRDAAKYCAEAVESIIKCTFSQALPKTSRILALIFKQLQQHDISQQLFLQAIDLYKSIQVPLGQANCCAEYADLLTEMKQFNHATACYQDARRIFTELGLQKSVVLLDEQMEPMYVESVASHNSSHVSI